MGPARTPAGRQHAKFPRPQGRGSGLPRPPQLLVQPLSVPRRPERTGRWLAIPTDAIWYHLHSKKHDNRVNHAVKEQQHLRRSSGMERCANGCFPAVCLWNARACLRSRTSSPTVPRGPLPHHGACKSIWHRRCWQPTRRNLPRCGVGVAIGDRQLSVQA